MLPTAFGLVATTRAAVFSALVGLVSVAAASPVAVRAQSAATFPAVGRDSALRIALARGSRAAIAAATARSATARVSEAGAIANPVLAASYSKSVPQYHAIVELPLDFLTMRGLRISAARSASEAAQLRLTFERAAVQLDVDTAYTSAAAHRALASLSARNAADADSLLVVARVRRDAGDASDLDVDVASINAGRTRNVAVSDSMAALGALLDLQQTLGLPGAEQSISLRDSLAVPSVDSLVAAGGAADSTSPLALPVAAARRDLEAADRTLALEKRSIWSGLALSGGFENHDPTGAEPGLLPTVGFSIPLPLFNQAQGAVAVATADRDRARVELAVAEREGAALVSRARRDFAAAAARVARDRELVTTADRVARLSLRAYAEGEYPLTTVLEAQRNARETLAALIDDLVAANGAAAALRLYSGTAKR